MAEWAKTAALSVTALLSGESKAARASPDAAFDALIVWSDMQAEEKIVELVIFISEHFWSGRLPEPHNAAAAIAAILRWAPENTPRAVWDRTAFYLAQAFDILRRQKTQQWVN